MILVHFLSKKQKYTTWTVEFVDGKLVGNSNANNPKGSFNNYVDQILPNLDHLKYPITENGLATANHPQKLSRFYAFFGQIIGLKSNYQWYFVS